jgi:hypothetical protein
MKRLEVRTFVDVFEALLAREIENGALYDDVG